MVLCRTTHSGSKFIRQPWYTADHCILMYASLPTLARSQAEMRDFEDFLSVFLTYSSGIFLVSFVKIKEYWCYNLFNFLMVQVATSFAVCRQRCQSLKPFATLRYFVMKNNMISYFYFGSYPDQLNNGFEIPFSLSSLHLWRIEDHIVPCMGDMLFHWIQWWNKLQKNSIFIFGWTWSFKNNRY